MSQQAPQAQTSQPRQAATTREEKPVKLVAETPKKETYHYDFVGIAG